MFKRFLPRLLRTVEKTVFLKTIYCNRFFLFKDIERVPVSRIMPPKKRPLAKTKESDIDSKDHEEAPIKPKKLKKNETEEQLEVIEDKPKKKRAPAKKEEEEVKEEPTENKRKQTRAAKKETSDEVVQKKEEEMTEGSTVTKRKQPRTTKKETSNEEVPKKSKDTKTEKKETKKTAKQNTEESKTKQKNTTKKEEQTESVNEEMSEGEIENEPTETKVKRTRGVKKDASEDVVQKKTKDTKTVKKDKKTTEKQNPKEAEDKKAKPAKKKIVEKKSTENEEHNDEDKKITEEQNPKEAEDKKDKPAKKKIVKKKSTEKEEHNDEDKKNNTETRWEAIDFDCDKMNADGNASNMKITSWNVGGMKSWLKKDGLNILQYASPDILCLQETKCNSDLIPKEIDDYDGYHKFWCSSDKNGYAGVGLLTKKEPLNVTYGIGDEEQDAEGRCVTAEFDEFFLVNVYVPNAGRKLVTLDKRLEWNQKFKDFIVKLDKQKPVIVCGDLNVAHNEIDLANPKSNKKNAGFTQEERDGMSDFLEAGFQDTFRDLYPDKADSYTFWTYMMGARKKNIGWRLDYFLVSERIKNMVCDSKIHPEVFGSDHCPLTLFINI